VNWIPIILMLAAVGFIIFLLTRKN